MVKIFDDKRSLKNAKKNSKIHVKTVVCEILIKCVQFTNIKNSLTEKYYVKSIHSTTTQCGKTRKSLSPKKYFVKSTL